MTEIRLLATPKGNGYQATVSFPDGVFFNSAESYPTIREAMGGSGAKAARHDRPPGGARSGGFAGADRDELDGAPSKEIGEIGGRTSSNLDRVSTEATK